ncbi:MAG: hypothetical protein P8N52_09500 [Crocinitomicaceae bacterium]|nr:hypothetical protein [Crocinitomicaceae bacterium]
MNRLIKYSIFCLTLILVGCGPSDEELLRNAESTVQSFIDELNMQNFNSANDIYPEMSKISRYKIPKILKFQVPNLHQLIKMR